MQHFADRAKIANVSAGCASSTHKNVKVLDLLVLDPTMTLIGFEVLPLGIANSDHCMIMAELSWSVPAAMGQVLR